jgi:hypothetical protein
MHKQTNKQTNKQISKYDQGSTDHLESIIWGKEGYVVPGLYKDPNGNSKCAVLE